MDLIYAPSGVAITDEVLARAQVMDVLAHRMPVLCPTDLMVMKLLSLREQNLNLTSTIATARAVREQIDWKILRERTAGSPYARGFFVMAEGLDICPPEGKEKDPSLALSGVQRAAMTGGDFEQRDQLIRHLSSARRAA